MVIVLRALGRDKEMIETFDKFTKDPRFFEEMPQKLLNYYAYVLYEHTKRSKEGVEIARKAVKADPQKGWAWDTLACNLQAIGNDKEALEAFKKALSLKKSDKEITWDALAKLYERMGRKEEAEQAYEKFKAIEKKEAKRANNVDQ